MSRLILKCPVLLFWLLLAPPIGQIVFCENGLCKFDLSCMLRFLLYPFEYIPQSMIWKKWLLPICLLKHYFLTDWESDNIKDLHFTLYASNRKSEGPCFITQSAQFAHVKAALLVWYALSPPCPTWQVNPIFICSLPFSFTRSQPLFLYLC